MNFRTTSLGIVLALTGFGAARAEAIYWSDSLGLHRANLGGGDPLVLLPSRGSGLPLILLGPTYTGRRPME